MLVNKLLAIVLNWGDFQLEVYKNNNNNNNSMNSYGDLSMLLLWQEKHFNNFLQTKIYKRATLY